MNEFELEIHLDQMAIWLSEVDPIMHQMVIRHSKVDRKMNQMAIWLFRFDLAIELDY